jgi:hypothetical protein
MFHRVPHQQRALTFKATPFHPFFLLAACFQQVPAEELLVTPQLPFWGDVSPSSRCEAALLSSGRHGSPRNAPDASKPPPRDGFAAACSTDWREWMSLSLQVDFDISPRTLLIVDMGIDAVMAEDV